jgi:DNA-directed RNA polymerase
MLTDTMELQLSLEEQSLNEGRNRWLKNQEKKEQNQGYGARNDVSKLIKGCLPLLSQHISAYLTNASNGGKGKTATAVAFLRELSPDTLASLTLSIVFGSIRRQPLLSQVLIILGRAVENELWGKALEEFNPKLYERLVARAVKTHGSISYRRKAVRATAVKEGFMFERWADDTRVKVAEPLLNSLLQSLPQVFEVYTTYEKFDKVQKWLGITQEASQYLVELTEAESWMHPVYRPMVVQRRFGFLSAACQDLRQGASQTRT